MSLHPRPFTSPDYQDTAQVTHKLHKERSRVCTYCLTDCSLFMANVPTTSDTTD